MIRRELWTAEALANARALLFVQSELSAELRN